MHRPVALASLVLLGATAAAASNTGFSLNYVLGRPVGRSGSNLVSFPTFYAPNGNVAAPVQNSVDLCRDVNDGPTASKVKTVFRYDPQTDSVKSQSCASTIKIFDLVPGEAYSLVPAADNTTIHIAGTNDDSRNKNKTPTPVLFQLHRPGQATGNNWFSVPYHMLANNSVDLCKDLNDNVNPPPKVKTVIRFDPVSDAARTQSCASSIKVFDLTVGEGYSLIPAADNIGVSVSVY